MKRNACSLLLFASCLLSATAVFAEDGADKFLRIERDSKKQAIALQTAVVRYEPAADDEKRNGLQVDLIGAVHVGEKSYYDELNKAFENYDVVLYELVAAEGTRVPKGGKSSGGHPVAMLQNGMKSVLELEHQLEHIDYLKPNLVHADMSPDDFAKSMEKRGESFWTMFVKLMSQGMAQQARKQAAGKSQDVDILMALFDKNRARAMKRVFAEQFEDLGETMAAFDGPEGSTIISERNKKALEGLTKQIEAGKKHIAIFYGAGHFPDMQKRLLADFQLQRGETRWLTAWDLSDKPAAPKPAAVQLPGPRDAQPELPAPADAEPAGAAR